MNNLMKYLDGILMLALITEMVGSPEQRAEWARQNDWDHYASRYTD